MSDMSGRRWNQLIDAVNNNLGKETIIPPLDEEDEKIFESMQRELWEMRQKYGERQMFSPVEIDYDEILDIYHDE